MDKKEKGIDMNRENGIISNRQTELTNCTFVKTVLMLIVLIYHCIIFWTGSWFVKTPTLSAEPLSWASRWMNTFHIYGFALVSGYLFYYLRIEKGKYAQFGRFVLNKAKRLLVPYAVVSAVWIVPISAFFYSYGAWDIVKNHLLGIAPGQLWFLLMLFFVFLMFYPLSHFFAKHEFAGAFLALAFYGVGYVGAFAFPNVLQIFRACTYMPFFLLEFKLRQHGNRVFRKIPVFLWIIADVLLFLAVELLRRQNGRLFTLLSVGMSFLLQAVGALMAFFVLQKIANHVKWKESKAFALFSKHSMPIYLFHQQVIYFVIYWLNGLLNPYIHAT